MVIKNKVISKPLISLHTNKPVTRNESPPSFWCKTCNLKLKNTYVALQHCRGRPHKFKMTANKSMANQSNQTGADSKRTHLLDYGNVRPLASAEGPAPSPINQCDICSLTFSSTSMTMQHFQGKRHAEAKQRHIAKANIIKNSANQNNPNVAAKRTHLLELNNVGCYVPTAQMYPVRNQSPIPAGNSNLHVPAVRMYPVRNPSPVPAGNTNLPVPAARMYPVKNQSPVPAGNSNLSVPTARMYPVKNQSPIPAGNSNLTVPTAGMYPVKNQIPVPAGNSNLPVPATRMYPVKNQIPVPAGNSKLPVENVRCAPCDVVLNSPAMAIQHYEGKRHAATIQAMDAEKVEATQNEAMKNKANQNNQNTVPKRNSLLEFNNARPVGPVSHSSIANLRNEQPAESILPMQYHAVQSQTSEENTISAPKRKHLLELDGDGYTDGPAESAAKKNKEEAILAAPVIYKCDDCNITFMNEYSSTQHYEGKRHAKILATKKDASQNETMSRWQNRGVATGAVSHRNRDTRDRRGDQYSLLNLTPENSNRLLRKAVLPGKLSKFMNAGRTIHGNPPPYNNGTAQHQFPPDHGMYDNRNQASLNGNYQRPFYNDRNDTYDSNDNSTSNDGYRNNIRSTSSASFGNSNAMNNRFNL